MLSSIHFPVRSYSLEALQPDAGAKSATLMLVKYEKSPPKDEQKGPEKAPGERYLKVLPVHLAH
ncbi:hypothetical protein O1V64_16505 [Rouxiella badensis]|nr:hypothetical protein O1V64_16505 [Rouxiella badensis]